MNYLSLFVDFFSSGRDVDVSFFSEKVLKDLQKSRSELEQDGIILDIEPIQVSEHKKESSEHTIFCYTGSYIYGFQKNGIFHEIPNNLDSQRQREKNEDGDVIFYVNKKTGKIDTITESFAGNRWGVKLKSKYGDLIWTILGFLFFAVFMGRALYIIVNAVISSYTVMAPLHEYDQDIQQCVKEKQKLLGDQKVVGIEYSCAIKKAATFYEEDPEKAIQLCMIYNPLIDVQLGRERSTSSADDIWAEREENIAHMACVRSLEERIKEKSPSLSLEEFVSQ